MRNFVAFLGIVAVASMAQGQTLFLNPVYDLPRGTDFEVVDQLGTDTARIWCDATRAARSRGARTTDRVYVLRVYGPSQSRPQVDGVAFTFNPSQDLMTAARALTGPRTLSLSALGNNMTVGQGNGYCVFEIDG